MTSLLIPLLGAEGSPLWQIANRFRAGRTGYSVEGVLVVAGIAAATIAILWLLKRWSPREQVAYRSPRRLVHELCRAHKLTWRETRLLHAVAKREQLAHLSELFIDPIYLDRAAQAAGGSAAQGSLEKLRERLFAK